MPACGQWTGFGFAVANNARGDQVGIVEYRPISVCKRITQLASFMYRARRFGGDVAWNAAGKRKLLEQPLHPTGVLRDVRINLAVRSFQIGVRHESGATMSRTSDIDHAEVPLFDDSIK